MNGRSTRKQNGDYMLKLSMPMEQAYALYCEMDEWEEEDLGVNEIKLKRLLAAACRNGMRTGFFIIKEDDV